LPLITITLAILALFIAAITIRRTLSSFVVTHHHGRVVASSMLCHHPPPPFIAPVAG
jgi:hypothetical protein